MLQSAAFVVCVFVNVKLLELSLTAARDRRWALAISSVACQALALIGTYRVLYPAGLR